MILFTNISFIVAAPTPKVEKISFLTKGSAITAGVAGSLLYMALSSAYKTECLEKDEVVESKEFKQFVRTIIDGIFSSNLLERARYRQQYPKITTFLMISLFAAGTSVVLAGNDFCNFLVRPSAPKVCTMQTQCSEVIIENDCETIVNAADDAQIPNENQSFAGTTFGLSMKQIEAYYPIKR